MADRCTADDDDHLPTNRYIKRAGMTYEGTGEPLPTEAEDYDPLVMVGKRIEIRWSYGRWYKGVVASYDAAAEKHHVEYDDGDTGDYDLKTKTYVEGGGGRERQPPTTVDRCRRS